MTGEKSKAQEFLFEQGVVGKRTRTQRQVLACLACRFAREGQFHGYDAIRCRRALSHSGYLLLSKMELSGLVVSEPEGIDPRVEGRPARRIFKPSDTPLGREFLATLEPPDQCYLEEQGIVEDPLLAKLLAHVSSEEEGIGAGMVSPDDKIIDESSGEGLEWPRFVDDTLQQCGIFLSPGLMGRIHTVNQLKAIIRVCGAEEIYLELP